MPDTTPLPLPECPREDCTTHVVHWHWPSGGVSACPDVADGRDCEHDTEGSDRCYAPRTQPAPARPPVTAILAAILAAAEDAKRAHDRLCDLAETLLPESSPVKTAENPAPVVLPTVDEVAEVIHLESLRSGFYSDYARAALDFIAARVPVWVPVAPGTVIKAGTRWRFESGEGATLRVEEETAATPYTCRPSSARYFIDPRTVPAEPDAALIADLRQYVTSATSDDELRDMIAAVRKADDARADQ